MTDVVPFTDAPAEDPDFVRHLAALEERWTGLPDKPEETPETTLRALWLAAAGDPCSAEAAAWRELPRLDGDGRRILSRLVARRLSGLPLARLTRRQHFMGLELVAGPEALVPRRETEVLGYAALGLLRDTVRERGWAKVFDLCTGSGNLALALAHHEPACDVVGSDLSGEALGLAWRNARRLGLTSRVSFAHGDLFAPFEAARMRGAADLIVANPPYISAAKAAGLPTEIAQFEPRLAFDGGAFGVSVLLRLVAGASRYLRPGSWLCFEVGAGQGDPMATWLERAAAYSVIERVRNSRGEVRAVLARTTGRD